MEPRRNALALGTLVGLLLLGGWSCSGHDHELGLSAALIDEELEKARPAVGRLN